MIYFNLSRSNDVTKHVGTHKDHAWCPYRQGILNEVEAHLVRMFDGGDALDPYTFVLNECAFILAFSNFAHEAEICDEKKTIHREL